MKTGTRAALALVSGVITLFAFAPFGQWWLALPGAGLWLYLNLGTSPRTAFVTGLAFGFGLLAPGIYWIHHSMSVYSGMPFVLALGLAALLALLLSLYYALTGWLGARLENGSKGARLLLLVILFTASEWLRGWLFTGFPWLQLGYTQVDTSLAGFAPLGGVLLVTLATILSAALLVHLLVAARRRNRIASFVALVLVWGGGELLQHFQWTVPTGAQINVAMIQGNIPQDKKWLPEHYSPTLDYYREESIRQSDAEIVIWPESAIPDLLENVEQDYVVPLRKALQASNTTLVTGVLTNPQQGIYYNSILATGERVDIYHKRHLVPFGEFFPLGWLWKGWFSGLATMGDDFTAGPDSKPLLQINGHTAGASVCYEIIFPEEIRQALPEAGFLINLSNDGWFGATHGPLQHFQMARMRAIETGRPLLRATNTGITAVISADGSIAARLPQFERGVLRAAIATRQGITPYAEYGLLVVAGVLLLLALLLVLIRRRV